MKAMATQQSQITLAIGKNSTLHSFYLMLDNEKIILNIDINNTLIDNDDINIYTSVNDIYYKKENDFLTLEEMMFNNFYKNYFVKIYEMVSILNNEEYAVVLFLKLLKQLIEQIDGDNNV